MKPSLLFVLWILNAAGEDVVIESVRDMNVPEGCKNCPAGYYSSASKNTRCEQCSAGYFQSATEMTSCALCQTGFTP